MKQKIVYTCEFCDSSEKKYFDSQCECKEHEATHFGLTLKEYNEWECLCTCAAHAGSQLGYSKNERTEQKFNTAIDNLVNFEQKHNLLHVKRKPTQFYH